MGMPGAPRHFHALLTAHRTSNIKTSTPGTSTSRTSRKLNQQVVADLWIGMAGRRKNGAGANVRIYDPNLGGLAYTLKFINQPDGPLVRYRYRPTVVQWIPISTPIRFSGNAIAILGRAS